MDLNQNYFEVFDLPVAFGLDLDALGDRYLALQKALHPDRYASASDQEKRRSMQSTTLVNTAYETLKSPLKRAIYLLEMKGVDIAHNPQLPPAFLMAQIELREELEEIEADTSLERLDAFRDAVRGKMRAIESGFAEVIDTDSDTDTDLAAAEVAVYELQFLNKLLLEAKQLEEKLLDY